jgi:ribosomal protein S18 acetylase RimI-like enzyme
MSRQVNETSVRRASLEDLDACYSIENQCFGAEGASKEKIRRRIVEYPDGFFVLEYRAIQIGFINSGCCTALNLADEALKSMVDHDPEGDKLVIFSLAIHPEYQKRGFSKILLDTYLRFARRSGKQQILLICQKRLIEYYRKFGFICLGESGSAHGGLHWFEMSYRVSVD